MVCAHASEACRYGHIYIHFITLFSCRHKLIFLIQLHVTAKVNCVVHKIELLKLQFTHNLTNELGPLPITTSTTKQQLLQLLLQLLLLPHTHTNPYTHTHTHTPPCTSLFVRTFRGLMYCPTPYPNPIHTYLTPTLTLTQTLITSSNSKPTLKVLTFKQSYFVGLGKNVFTSQKC